MLTICPTTSASASTYRAYRETNAKLFVPKFFGLKHFGLNFNSSPQAASPHSQLAEKNSRQNGNGNGDKNGNGNGNGNGNENEKNAIDPNPLTFCGSLRPEQVPAVDSFFKALDDNQTRFGTACGGGGLFELPCGFGKTDTALYVLAEIRKRILKENCDGRHSACGLTTMVVVHKDFLAEQWIERIGIYFPSARIGRIQGTTVDVKDKDIVICMIQSLSMKTYSQHTFDSFGFLLVDEVHRSSSEVFSQIFFKLSPRYSLGLSATMERKDGASYVFKYFLGDIVYTAKRPVTHKVIVRAIRYEVDDDEFNEVVMDRSGERVAYSTMINKLCDYMPRTELVLATIINELAADPNDQIIVLAQNKSILKTLHREICARQIGGDENAVGFYIGGMKKADLDASSSKKIILATYAMAAEALDIKTLRKLIMATPKSDIVQSVGRILREKGTRPVVIDIIDPHFVFINQAKKRRAFFEEENYQIVQCRSDQYMSCTRQWQAAQKTKPDHRQNHSANDLIRWSSVFRPKPNTTDLINSRKREHQNQSQQTTQPQPKRPKNMLGPRFLFNCQAPPTPF